MITIALSKGRIFDETLPLLQAAGIQPILDDFSRAVPQGDDAPQGDNVTQPKGARK